MCVLQHRQSSRGYAADSFLEEALAQQLPQNPPSPHTCANKGVRKTTKLQQVSGKYQTMCEKGTQSLNIDTQSFNLGASATIVSTKPCQNYRSAADT